MNSNDMSAMHADAAYGPDPDGVLGIMYTRVVANPAETKIQGRPVFESVPFCKIMVPGDDYSVVDERLNDDHKGRWPKVWEAFEAKQSGMAVGTPIQEMTVLTAVEVATLRSYGIVSVEMLSNIADSKLNMQITREMRERARQYLQGAPETERELRRDNAELRKELAALTEQVKTLSDALGKLGVDQEKGRRKAA